MAELEFLQKIKEKENLRIAKGLKNNPLFIEQETLQMFEFIKKNFPDMVELVDFENIDQFNI